jgi:uncharacterized protein (DUF885 family)
MMKMTRQRFRKSRLHLALIFVPALSGSADAQDGTAEFHKLIAQYDEWRAVEYTTWDASIEAFDRHHEALEEMLRDLAAIDPGMLGERERDDYQVLHALLEDWSGFCKYEHLLPITARKGVHFWLAEWGANRQHWAKADLDAYARDLEMIPGLIDTTIAHMERGLARGWTPPRETISDVPHHIEDLLGAGMEQIAWPFGAVSDPDAEQDVDELWRRFYDQTRPAIERALRRLAEYLENTYLPACRTSIAITDLPGGAEWYALQLHTLAETDISPREIHELGISEIRRIENEMIPLISQTDFLDVHPNAAEQTGDALLRAFNDYLRSDCRFRYEGPEAVVGEYCRVAKFVDGWLPSFFGRLPHLPFGISAAPPQVKGIEAVQYRMGDLSEGFASSLFVNVSSMDLHRTFEVTPLVLHETMPGHHLQMALARELEDLPSFRREVYFSAFGEGWGLYVESLGLEMGLYRDSYRRLGLLAREMHHACRLVVDTGINALGWPRERAIEFMLDHTALPPDRIDAEIGRYVADPGQACSYKIGELRIRELRREAERRLGSTFDLRAFHDVLLGAGSVPLAVLERRVHSWVNAIEARQRD